jgi:hypothetical protein
MHHVAYEHPHGEQQAWIPTESVGYRKIRHSLWFEVELFSRVSATQKHSQLPATGQETGVEYEDYLIATHVTSVE